MRPRIGWLFRLITDVKRFSAATRNQYWVPCSIGLFGLRANFLRMKQDHRSERRSLQRFEHPHPLPLQTCMGLKVWPNSDRRPLIICVTDFREVCSHVRLVPETEMANRLRGCIKSQARIRLEAEKPLSRRHEARFEFERGPLASRHQTHTWPCHPRMGSLNGVAVKLNKRDLCRGAFPTRPPKIDTPRSRFRRSQRSG